MLALIAYLILIIALLIFLISISIYTLFLIYSSIMGSPYVPTKQKEVNLILKEAQLIKGSSFLELGCGDGRVVLTAARIYQINGKGIDINPVLINIARLKSLRQQLNRLVSFHIENIFQSNLSNFNYIYLFLMPELITKLSPKLNYELKKGTVVISHGFRIIGWEAKLYKTLNHRPFATYYYRV